MEKSIALIAFCLLYFAGVAQEEPKREFEITEGDTTYVMKQYIFCLYLAGPDRSQSEEETNRIQEAHLKHTNAMVEENGLQVAGPFGDDGEKRGILVFDLPTVEDAERAMSEDPAVKAGRLVFECHPWWTAKGSTLH